MTESITSVANDSTTHPSRRSDIQGLRAIAVLAVVMFHAGLPMPGGFVGVDVFFVVSGFVITEMLLREWNRSGRISLAAFYRRRFFRLAPALAAVIVFVGLATAIMGSPLGGQAVATTTAIATTFLGANIAVDRLHNGYFGASAQSNPLLHMWSLSVEEQFYLVFPIALIIAMVVGRRLLQSRQFAIGVITLLSLISFAATLWGASGRSLPGGLNFFTGFYSPLTRMWEFGVGALLSLLPAVKFKSDWLLNLVRLTGFAGLTASLFIISPSTTFPGFATLLPVLSTAVLIKFEHTSVLANPALVRIGDWSYSWYLWHWPLIVFVELLGGRDTAAKVAAALIALGFAYISFRFLEQPLRKMGQHPLRLNWKGAVAVAVAPLIAIALMVQVTRTHGGSERAKVLWGDISRVHIARQQSCAVGAIVAPKPPANCVFNRGAQGAPVYLIGDSHAIVFSDPVVAAAKRVQRPVTVWTMDGCPPLRLDIVKTGVGKGKQERCHAYQERVNDWILSQPPGTVILSIFHGYATAEKTRLSIPGEALSGDGEVKRRYLRDALTQAVRSWQSAEMNVLLIQDAPSFDWDPKLCTIWQVNSSGCAVTLPRDVVVGSLSTTRSDIATVSDRLGVSVVDALPLACSSRSCSNAEDGHLRYQDADHLTVATSMKLTSQIQEVLTALSQ